MPTLSKLIWVLASGGNLLILWGLVKRRAWSTMPTLCSVQFFWFGLVLVQDFGRLTRGVWFTVDIAGTALYVAVAAILIFTTRMVMDADMIPVLYVVMAILKIIEYWQGFDYSRDTLLPLRQIIGIGADYWFAWCLIRGMILPRGTYASYRSRSAT